MSVILAHLSSLPLAGSFGYLAAVYSIHSFMSNRKAMTIPKSVLVLYNAAQVIINAYVAYKIAEPLGGRVWGIGLKDTPAVRYGVYLHMLCKYLDFTDTLIIVSCSRFARAFFCASGRRASRPPSLSLPLSPTAMLTAASLSLVRAYSAAAEEERATLLPALVAPRDDPARMGLGGQHVAHRRGERLGRVCVRRVDQLDCPRHHVLLL